MKKEKTTELIIKKHWIKECLSKRSGKIYKRAMVTVECPLCNLEFTRSRDNLWEVQKCKKCSQLENNIKKRGKFWSGVGELSGSLYNAYKQKARTGNKEFTLSKEYLWELFLKQERKCAISGIPLRIFTITKKSSTNKSSHVDSNMFTCSLDRIDCTKGYIEGNVQWVHKVINIMRNTLEVSDFIYMCKQVSENNKLIDNTEPSFIYGNCGSVIMRKVQRLIDEQPSNNSNTSIPYPQSEGNDIV